MQEQDKDVWYRYKYREMTETNLKIITEGTLMFSSPASFNDPFDCSPAYDMQSIEQLQRLQPDLLRRAAKAQGLSPAKRIESRGKFVAKARRAVESGTWAKKLVAPLGILCLSRNPCSPLMWAHYAGNHTGFLIEFRIGPDAPEADLERIVPQVVEYVEHRPMVQWGDSNSDHVEYVLTKSRDWAYEEEERTIKMDGGPGIYPYPRKHFLHSVTAGARMNDINFAELKAAVENAEEDANKHIPLYRARLSSTSYRVFIPGHPDPRHSAPE